MEELLINSVFCWGRPDAINEDLLQLREELRQSLKTAVEDV
jgi:hypothetical protein